MSILIFFATLAWAQTPAPQVNIQDQIQQLLGNENLKKMEEMTREYAELVKKLPPPEQLEKMRPLLESPMMQKYAQLLTIPGFPEALAKMASTPKQIHLVYIELILMGLLISLRAWLSSSPRPRSVLQNLWTSVWTFSCYLILGLYLLPTWFYGPEYGFVLKGFYQVFCAK